MEVPAQGDLAPTELIALANADPVAVLHATELAPGEPAQVATCVRMRARAMAQRALGNYDDASTTIELAATVARALGDVELEAQCLITHAPLPAFAGRVAHAHELLDRARELAPDRFDAEIAFQRAGIAALVADWRHAGEIYTDAIERFDREGDDLGTADALMTRGLMMAYVGDMNAADDDFDRARDLFGTLDDTAGIGLVQWNRALSLVVNGEAAEAVIEFEAARAVFATTTYPVDELLGDLSEAYFSVGLEQEAIDAATDCVASFYPGADRNAVVARRELGSARNPLDAASRTLELARALAMTGALDAARAHAEHAHGQFQLHGQQLRARRAEALLLAIMLDMPDALGGEQTALNQLADQAVTLAAAWESSTDVESRGEAELISVRAAITCGDHERARAALTDLASRPLTFRHELERAEYIATLAIIEGDSDRAATTVLGAFDAARDRQLLTGSSFVTAAQSRRFGRLLSITLPGVLTGGDVDTAFQLIERADLSPATQSAKPAVADHHQRALHAEYRSIATAIDEARSNRQDTAALHERQREIATRIRQTTSSTATVVAGPLRVANAPVNRYVVAGDILWSLEGSNRDLTSHDLGPVAPIGELIEKLNRQVRLQFERPDDRRLSRLLAMADALDEMLGMPGHRDGETLHIIASPSLPSFPWGLLGSLAQRSWSRAARGTERSEHTDRQRGSGFGLIGGTNLSSADAEIAALATGHPNAVTVTGHVATVEAALDVLARCDLAHIASHATVNHANPMFSSLTLADGELSLYELEGLPTKPTVMVIASCWSADEQRVGTTGVGIATALLHSGVELVVGAAVELPDSPAMATVMVELHKRLREDPFSAVRHTVQYFSRRSPEWLIAGCLTPCVREPWAVSAANPA